jgi:endonuclease/exonuclease/phosphatase (EEP) superfamily protein YafD
VHATSPGSYGHFRQRNAQLERLAELINASTLPTILVGDLNTVTWDRALGRLCRAAGLQENPQCTNATWPSLGGLALIPLDHVLVTAQLSVSSLESFSIKGSDHRGLSAQIQYHL